MRPDVTMPGYHKGRIPANKGKKCPAEILTPQEVSALFDQISSTTSIGLRNRALVARQAGIEKRVHPHGLRHTHAYELMMEGVEIAIIQRQLGHVSLATTAIHLNHIAPRQVIETMRKRAWRP
ncbi:MAG: tyrosine-type recombinase/integrase [Actinomycetota bacterium]